MRRRHLWVRAVTSGLMTMALISGPAMTASAAGSGFSPMTGSPYAAGAGTAEVAVGDFNGDGHKDLAATNEFAHNVTVLLGQAGGGYTEEAGSPIAVGQRPFGITSADFNGDGMPDLAVANFYSNNVTILLRQTGGFVPESGSPVAVGSNPHAVRAADFNGDGRPDLAVANGHSDDVTILLRLSGAGFAPAPGSPVAAGTGPADLAIADFTGDGQADIAVANAGSGTVTLLFNQNGTFAAEPASPAVGADPYGLDAGDFNGDGLPDLAVAHWNNSNNVTVLLRQAGGGFAEETGSPFAVGSTPYDVAAGDFDGDGKVDLAVANANSSNVTVLLRQAAGGFAEQDGSPFGVGTYPLRITAADLNGDAKPDLATGNEGGYSVSVLLNGGGGSSGGSGGTCTSGSSAQATQCTAVVVKPSAPGELSISLGKTSVDFGALDPGTTSAPIALGDISYRNTLDNGTIWSATVSATSLVSTSGDVIGFSQMNFVPGSAITPAGPVPGTGGTFSGTDTTPGTTYSDPLTLANAQATDQGDYTQSGSTATLAVPAAATAGAHTGTLQYTITG